MRTVALASIAWRHPWATLLSPVCAVVVVLALVYSGADYVWTTVPHQVLAAAPLALAGLIAGVTYGWRRFRVSPAGRWWARHRLTVWGSLAAVAATVLLVGALSASGRG
jgi:hypothetical protein